MIAFVRGTVQHVGVDLVVVDLGAVGVAVQCTPATALSLRRGDLVELMTTLVVREDSWTLFGFADPDERTVFEQVQTVSGIGPRIALALLGTLSPDELRRAIAAGDETALTRVPGIGRKGAQRLILELADRLGPATSAGLDSRGGATVTIAGGWQQSVVAGLTSLGWSAREADHAVATLDPAVVADATAADEPDVGRLLKAALRALDRS
jgi:Holliday junction DNA helicase RuvA